MNASVIYLSEDIFINPRVDGIIEICQSRSAEHQEVLNQLNYLTARNSFGMTVMQILPSLTFQEVHTIQQKLNIIYHF
ncbi:hypothetical protein ACFQ5M_01155 [Agrilactobacillus yilanensis]|uniref:Uncharacterized protein n=1 Tax=Agrilactobacillus yilanensis TaxID=2485997 RepID=A0ABW4J2T9_9LACO|nr:hypothetical protein [Agrilactobacillus yilanensis]